MPAMLDDPTSAPIPAPKPTSTPHIAPRVVSLRDGTLATLFPFTSPSQAPAGMVAVLSALLNYEIRGGNTYPMTDEVPLEKFGPYWFGLFAAVMLAGDGWDAEALASPGVDWEQTVLGTFYIKPNYPGRSSHVSNGGFLVSPKARAKGVGKLMGRAYVDWAPRLGYTYSIFNLVYETNVASIKVWESLGFERVGRVKGCGRLAADPSTPVDAIVFGRELKVTDE